MRQAIGFKPAKDGKFWMSIEDYVKYSTGIDYARTFGPGWKKITQYAHFSAKKLTATAQWAYAGGANDEISFKAGDQLEVHKVDPGWWTGKVVGSSKVGFFPGNYVKTNDRPICCYELTGTPSGKEPITAVVMCCQPLAHRNRKFYKRKQDGLNYKDTKYAAMNLLIVGPDDSVALKRKGKRREISGEISLPGGGKWKIYVSSEDGTGSMFYVRTFLKNGTGSLSEVQGAKMSDMEKYLG